MFSAQVGLPSPTLPLQERRPRRECGPRILAFGFKAVPLEGEGWDGGEKLHYLFTHEPRHKQLEAMCRNPLDWRIEQLQTVARQHGIDWRQEGTSHCVFVRADGKTLPVPAHRPIKPVYVKKFVALVKGD